MTKGLIYILTGEGKGKTTAAFGLALRAAGHNLRTLVIQFIKDQSWPSGEVKYIAKHIPEIDIYTVGRGFVGIIGDNKPRKLHQQKAQAALDFLAKKIKQKKYHILILDEVNVAVDLELIDVDKIANFLRTKPKKLNVVLTGRQANNQLLKLAGIVSEIKNIKHCFNQGILAQKGIDF